MTALPDAGVAMSACRCRCGKCAWSGPLDEMAKQYQPNPQEPGDVIPVLVCPVCGSSDLHYDLTPKEAASAGSSEIVPAKGKAFDRCPKCGADLVKASALGQLSQAV